MEAALADAGLARFASPFTPDWLTRQRWFRSKLRPVAGVEVADAAALDGGRVRLLVLAARYADGGEDRYLLPAVVDGDALREPRDGDGAWVALAERIAAGGELAATAGRFRFEPTAALGELVPSGPPALRGLAERQLRVEQSNSSTVLGERLILKLYRLLEAGTNADVEVSAFLTAAGFRHTPALAGAATYEPATREPSAAAMLQAFLPTRGDGWRWALGCLGREGGPAEAIVGIRQIGEITAQLHGALASRPEQPGFPARPALPEELVAWQAAAEGQLEGAVASLRGAERDRLAARESAIHAGFAAIGSAVGTPASRIHGDYHLGQLLRLEDGFAVIDFEGEPARPLAERRSPASPLRDVAGMLRSFDYAARSAARGGTPSGVGFAPDAWLAEAREAFLAAYGGIRPAEASLLAAFELEKACYEVRYEANNRPEWTWLPLAALERLLVARYPSRVSRFPTPRRHR